MEFKHTSVLLEETIENLRIKPEGIYVDGTLGGGGHAFAVCSRLNGAGHFYGIDQDDAAIAAAGERLAPFGERATLIRDNYCNMKQALEAEDVTGVDGIVLDLGVSSYQLDESERGFSYRYDTPLDMRMDRRQSLTAKEILNTWPEAELVRILRDYGEERCARNIARKIVAGRAEKEISTTGELNEIIRASIPAKMREKGGHPSKRTFQAVRIACNRELDVLSESLDMMMELLRPGGRLCIITFHSLEDRIVKSAFRRQENPCTCPPDFPVCICGKTPLGKVITRKPILPGEEEREHNTRSKSAKLRVFERF